jgi:hypothetical protein
MGNTKSHVECGCLARNATVMKKHFDIFEELQNSEMVEVDTNEPSITNLAVELKPIAI